MVAFIHLFRVSVVLVVWLVFSSTTIVANDSNDIALPKYSGHIVDDNENPIANASVFIYWQESMNGPARNVSLPPLDRIFGKATSNADGKFEIQWLETAPKWITWQPLRYFIVVICDDYVPFQSSIVLDDSGPVVTTIQMSLGVNYRDRIVDESGKPVAGAVVRLEGIFDSVKSTLLLANNERGRLYCDLSMAPTVRTDEDGRYEFDMAPKNVILMVRVLHPEYATSLRFRSNFDDLPTPPDLSETVFEDLWRDYESDIVLSKGKSVLVRVLDPVTKRPVENMEVCAVLEGRSYKTDQDGMIHMIAPNHFENHNAYIRKPDQLLWNEGFMKKVGDEYQIDAPKSIQVSGRVTDVISGNGIPNVPISSKRMIVGMTDIDGRYRVSILDKHVFPLFCQGPVDQWAIPFARKTTNPEEMEIPVRLPVDVRDINPNGTNDHVNFEYGLIPESKFRIIGLVGKAAAHAKFSIVPAAHPNQLGQELYSDDEGLVQVRLPKSYAYCVLVQGERDGAAVVTLKSLNHNIPFVIQLLPSITVNASVQNTDHDFNGSPAARAMAFGNDVSKRIQVGQENTATPTKDALGISNDVRLTIPLGRTDADGNWTCRLPKANTNVQLLIYGGGRYHDIHDMIELDTDQSLGTINLPTRRQMTEWFRVGR